MKNLLGSNQYKTKKRYTVNGMIGAWVLILILSLAVGHYTVIGINAGINATKDWAKQTFIVIADAPTKLISPLAQGPDTAYASESAVAIPTPTPEPSIYYEENAEVVAGDVQSKVFERMSQVFGAKHWSAMNSLLSHEAGFSPCKINGGDINCHYKGEKACGIYQVMPCTKLLSQCPDLSDVDCQNDWGMNYISSRYGNPTNAWVHWQSRVKIDGKDVGNWY